MDLDRTKITYGVIGIIGVFFFLTIAYYATGNRTSSQPANDEEAVVFSQLQELSPDDHVKWGTESEIILIEYSDLQCPACARFEEVLNEFADTYPEVANEVAFAYRHFPLVMNHANALSAAYAAEAAAQQGQFYEMLTTLFANQEEWETQGDPTGQYISYAEELGLDIEQFTADYESDMVRDKVAADQRSGEEVNVFQTPSFYLNGRRIQFGSATELSQILQAELAATSAADDPNTTDSAATAEAEAAAPNGEAETVTIPDETARPAQ